MAPANALVAGSPPQKTLFLVLGTYDGGIIGYRVDAEPPDPPDSVNVTLRRIFAITSHSGCVKALCAVGKHVVSGSSDETLRVYDLVALAEKGSLKAGRGSNGVAALARAGSNVILVLDYEGKITLRRTVDGALLKTIVTPKGKTSTRLPLRGAEKKNWGMALSVHPSCKLCLCLNGTPALFLMNLMEGSCAAAYTLEEPASDVRWSSCGELYALLSPAKAVVLCVGQDKYIVTLSVGGGVDCISPPPSQPLRSPLYWSCMCFGPNKKTLCLGDSSGGIDVFDLPGGGDSEAAQGGAQLVGTLRGYHKMRVKGISVCRSALGRQTVDIVSSCDSEGHILLWRLDDLVPPPTEAKKKALRRILPLACVA